MKEEVVVQIVEQILDQVIWVKGQLEFFLINSQLLRDPSIDNCQILRVLLWVQRQEHTVVIEVLSICLRNRCLSVQD